MITDFHSNAYVPARANWNRGQSPLNDVNNSSANVSNQSRGLSPIQGSPINNSTRASPLNRPRRTSSEYYEDVDPRFDSGPPEPNPLIPAALQPGGPRGPPPPNNSGGFQNDPSSSNEDVNDGSRSPAASEASHFTSISQRGVNPQWRGYENQPPMPQRNELSLDNNPDFSVPGGPPRGGRGGGRGGMMMRGGGGGRGGYGGREPGVIGTAGVGAGASRYPGNDAF